MKQPTEAQIKEFWEWCGATIVSLDRWGEEKTRLIETLDLNNLFKYAVPKLSKRIWVKVLEGWLRNYLFDTPTPDPALALFWAIWEVFKARK